MHNKITRREFGLRVAALAAGAATSSFRIVYAGEAVNPNSDENHRQSYPSKWTHHHPRSKAPRGKGSDHCRRSHSRSR